ncbi:MAG TPA: hypothetical protein VHF05_01745 [Candidatus Paceibacterota bacterium]|nr:hypothetical protein [Candidatus Paceibacterota bacterium]
MRAPGKKIFLVLLACILVIAGIYYAYKKTGSKAQNASTPDNLVQAVFSGQSDTDTDGDGLKDWEEALWRTDPNKADTDGDGTPDGEEIRESRDPLKANTAANGAPPTDIMASTTVSAALNNAATTTEMTSTDLFARAFFANYVQLKGEGITISSTTEQALIDETLQSGDYNLPVPKQYAMSDLHVSQDNSSAAYHAYGNKLARIIIDSSPKEKHDDEVTIFKNAVQKNDESALEGLDPIIDGYQKTLDGFLAMNVPSSIATYHLEIVNGISAMLTDQRAMRNLFKDAVPAYARFSDYQNDTYAMLSGLNAVVGYYKQNGIVFEQGEDGYKFMSTIQ